MAKGKVRKGGKGKGKGKKKRVDPQFDPYYQGGVVDDVSEERAKKKRKLNEGAEMQRAVEAAVAEEKEKQKDQKEKEKAKPRPPTRYQRLLRQIPKEDKVERKKDRKRKDRAANGADKNDKNEEGKNVTAELKKKEKEKKGKKQETEAEDEIEYTLDDVRTATDVFKLHYFTNVDPAAVEGLQIKKQLKLLCHSPALGRVYTSQNLHPDVLPLLQRPPLPLSQCMSADFAHCLHLKPKLAQRWAQFRGEQSSDAAEGENGHSDVSSVVGGFRSPSQLHLFRLFGQYCDVLLTQQTHITLPSLRECYLLHAVNHLLKVRDIVIKHNQSVSKAVAAGEAVPDIPADQGFTRPRVLILCPFRHTAYLIVTALLSLLPSLQADRVANKKRFLDEFYAEDDSDEEDEPSEDGKPNKRPQKKTADWKNTFAGNIDDCFTLGIAISRKTTKLYADFYRSDIIVTSPVGLMRVLQHGEEEVELLDLQKGDYDFLSSIEMAIVDSADVLLMQNWQHVQTLFSYMNRLPTQSHDTDFSRVREWALHGAAPLYRQTLIFSSLATPEVNALFNAQCLNRRGGVGLRASIAEGTVVQKDAACPFVPTHIPNILQIAPQVKQMFIRLDTPNPEQAHEVRFQFFKDQIYPRLKTITFSRTLIFVPSYFDFVRIKNLFKEDKDEIKYTLCSEYSSGATVARSRTEFFQGKVDYIITTERFYFFKRYRLRGIRNIYFYALPTYGTFYRDYLNMMTQTDEGLTSTVLYSPLDLLALERVVGDQRARMMLESQQQIYAFY